MFKYTLLVVLLCGAVLAGPIRSSKKNAVKKSGKLISNPGYLYDPPKHELHHHEHHEHNVESQHHLVDVAHHVEHNAHGHVEQHHHHETHGFKEPENTVELDITGLTPEDEIIVKHADGEIAEVEAHAVDHVEKHGHHIEHNVEVELSGLSPDDEVIIEHHDGKEHHVEIEVVEPEAPKHHLEAPIYHHGHHQEPEVVHHHGHHQEPAVVHHHGHHQEPEATVEVDITGLVPEDDIIVKHADGEIAQVEAHAVDHVEKHGHHIEHNVEVELTGLAPDDEVIIEHHDNKHHHVEIEAHAEPEVVGHHGHHHVAEAPAEEVVVLHVDEAGRVEPEIIETAVQDEVFVTEVQNDAPAAANHGASFFNVSFGKSKKGSIAVANSYSTGKKGTAMSHATSYGHA